MCSTYYKLRFLNVNQDLPFPPYIHLVPKFHWFCLYHLHNQPIFSNSCLDCCTQSPGSTPFPTHEFACSCQRDLRCCSDHVSPPLQTHPCSIQSKLLNTLSKPFYYLAQSNISVSFLFISPWILVSKIYETTYYSPFCDLLQSSPTGQQAYCVHLIPIILFSWSITKIIHWVASITDSYFFHSSGGCEV